MHTSTQDHLSAWRAGRSASQAAEMVRASLGMGVRPCHYVRTHVTSGTTYAANFNGSHAPEWSEHDWQHTSRARLMQLAMRLVERWNAGPEHALWHYELREGNAPQ